MPAFLLPDGHLQLVSGDSFILGSDERVQVRVVGAGVAPRHLIVQSAGDHWQAATLALQAPTWHNGQPLAGLVSLKDGDVLRVGDASLRWLPGVLAVAAPRPAGASPAASAGRATPWWQWVLLGSAIAAVLYAGWVLWDRWQAGTQVVSVPTPTPALTVVPTHTPTPPARAGHAPVYRIELNVIVIAPPVAEPQAEPPVSPTAAPSLSPEKATVPGAATTPAPPVVVTETPVQTPEPAGGTESAAAVAPATQPVEPSWVCTPPEGWRKVTVQRNQTVASFARRNSVNLERLRTANCLEGGRVQKGQTLYLPPRR